MRTGLFGGFCVRSGAAESPSELPTVSKEAPHPCFDATGSSVGHKRRDWGLQNARASHPPGGTGQRPARLRLFEASHRPAYPNPAESPSRRVQRTTKGRGRTARVANLQLWVKEADQLKGPVVKLERHDRAVAGTSVGGRNPDRAALGPLVEKDPRHRAVRHDEHALVP